MGRSKESTQSDAQRNDEVDDRGVAQGQVHFVNLLEELGKEEVRGNGENAVQDIDEIEKNYLSH